MVTATILQRWNVIVTVDRRGPYSRRMLMNCRSFLGTGASVPARYLSGASPCPRTSLRRWLLGHHLSTKATWAFTGSILLVLGALTGCAKSGPEVSREHWVEFACEGGAAFRVAFTDGHVRLETSTHFYDLYARPSSIGTKYASDEATLILDEDRSVLTGVDDGPFNRCHEV